MTFVSFGNSDQVAPGFQEKKKNKLSRLDQHYCYRQFILVKDFQQCWCCNFNLMIDFSVDPIDFIITLFS